MSLSIPMYVTEKCSPSEGIEPEYVSEREGDIRHSYADMRRAKVKLGFEPRTSLKEGLSALIRLSDKFE
jgi:nucleoside-diphosphate-sugar epimerase